VTPVADKKRRWRLRAYWQSPAGGEELLVAEAPVPDDDAWRDALLRWGRGEFPAGAPACPDGWAIMLSLEKEQP
jgi:hypothetical protein